MVFHPTATNDHSHDQFNAPHMTGQTGLSSLEACVLDIVHREIEARLPSLLVKHQAQAQKDLVKTVEDLTAELGDMTRKYIALEAKVKSLPPGGTILFPQTPALACGDTVKSDAAPRTDAEEPSLTAILATLSQHEHRICKLEDAAEKQYVQLEAHAARVHEFHLDMVTLKGVFAVYDENVNQHSNEIQQLTSELNELSNHITHHDGSLTQFATHINQHAGAINAHGQHLCEHDDRLTQANSQLSGCVQQLNLHTHRLIQYGGQLTRMEGQVNQQGTTQNVYTEKFGKLNNAVETCRKDINRQSKMLFNHLGRLTSMENGLYENR